MAVAHDNATESHTSTTGASADFSWTHTPVGTPAGILVFVINRGSAQAIPDATVTYGGVSVPAVSGAVAIDATASTEGSECRAFFLGDASAIAGRSGDSVAVSENGETFAGCWATAITVTASGDTEVPAGSIVLLQGDGTLAQQSVDDGSPGSNSVRYAAGGSGLGTVPGAGADSTALVSIDFGAYVNAAVRETTAGQGARSVGFSSGTSDDRAFVHLAVSEVPTPTSTSVARISLASYNPGAQTNHSILVRARTTSGSTGTIRAALYEGSTNRSGDLESSPLTNTLADYVLPIGDTEAGNITSYSDLEIRLWGYDSAGGALVFEVAELALEVPESTGDAWTLNPSDTITLSDTPTKVLVSAKTDTITLSDGLSRAWVAVASYSDTVTLSDSAAKAVGTGRADTVTLSDAASKSPGLSRADTVTLSDSLSRVWEALLSAGDTVTLSDAASKAIGLLEADTVTLSDLMEAVKLLVLELSDTITLSDSETKNVAASRSDTVTLADDLARAWAAVRSSADTVTLSDTPSRVWEAVRSADDTVTLSDSSAKAVGQNPADTITLSDSLGKAFGLFREDTTTLSDALGKAAGISHAETLTLSDDVAKVMGVASADTITLTDVFDYLYTPSGGTAHTLTLDDTITLAEALTKAAGLSRAETISLADDMARALNGQFLGQGEGVGGVFRKIYLGRFGIY